MATDHEATKAALHELADQIEAASRVDLPDGADMPTDAPRRTLMVAIADTLRDTADDDSASELADVLHSIADAIWHLDG